MKTTSNQLNRILCSFFTIVMFLTACQASPERESKPSADWSRSVSVGNYVNGSIGIVVDGTGERVHMVWPANLGDGVFLRYIQLDSEAKSIVEKEYKFSGLLRAPRLVAADIGKLHLFWASRLPGEKDWIVWHVLLDTDGNLLTKKRQISDPDESVGSYFVTSDQSGGALICWGGDSPGDIYIQHINQKGDLVGEPEIVTPNGQTPSIWADQPGNVYYAWQEEGSLVYARATLQKPRPEKYTVISNITQGTGKSIDGPYLGVAGGWVYVFWSVLNQSGLEAGTGYTAYTSFPADAPVNKESKRMLLSPAEEQPYEAYQGSYNITQLVSPLEEAWASSDFILSPNVMQGSQTNELAVALAMNQSMRMDQHLQIAVVIFRDGEFIGYSVGTKTQNISDDPVLFVDTARNLHIAWREGAAGNTVYYATTQPQAVVALERLNAGDIVNAIFQGGMEGLVGIAFLPVIGFGWLLPGMVVIIIIKVFRDQDNLTDWKHWIPLIFAVVLFYMVKFATLPTITTYVPFSAWLDIPERYSTPLRTSVPVLIFIIAAFVANQVRLRKTQSAAVFYIAFALVDAILTLAIYGVNFLGVY